MARQGTGAWGPPSRGALLAGVALLGGLAWFAWRGHAGVVLEGVSLGVEGYVLDFDPRTPLAEQDERPRYGDKLTRVEARPVSSLAEIGAGLREAQGPRVEVGLERRDGRVRVRATAQEYEARGFGEGVEPTDRVVAWEGREVGPDEVMDDEAIRALLAQRPGQSVEFELVRPRVSLAARLPVGSPPLRAWSLALFGLGLLGVIGAEVLGRRGGEGGGLLKGAFLGGCATAPWALSLLLAPEDALLDPWLLVPGVVGLGLWRALSLLLHRAARGGQGGVLVGACLLPGAALAGLGLVAALGLLPALWGGAVVGGAEEQVVMVLRGAGLLFVVLHAVDVALWARERGRFGWVRPLGPAVGLGLGALVAGLAGVAWASHGAGFWQGGFVGYLAAGSLAVWVGDLAAWVLPAQAAPQGEARAQLRAQAAAQRSAGEFLELARELVAPETATVIFCQRRAALRGEVVSDDEGRAQLALRDAGEIWATAVGLMRDERLSLPLPPGLLALEEEERPAGVEAVRGVAERLGWTTAFVLLDEAEQDGGVAWDEGGPCYAYLILERSLGDLELEARERLCEAFARAWPDLRGRFLEGLAGLGASPARAAAVAAEVAPVAAEVAPAVVEVAPVAAEVAPVAAAEVAPAVVGEVVPLVAEVAPAVAEAVPVAAAEVAPAVAEVAPAVAEPVPVVVAPAVANERARTGEVLALLRRDLARAYPVEEPGLLPASRAERLQALLLDDDPCVLVGPPGAGKEFAARWLHARWGEAHRRDPGPFLPFSASGCPPSLRALELLGEEPAQGLAWAARGGALFVEGANLLDEPLLRRLLERSAQPGAARLFLSARAPSLEALGGPLGALARGSLKPRAVLLPAIQDEPAQLELLADYYVLRWAMKHNRVITEVSPEARALLLGRDWPGGASQLKAELEAAVLRCQGERLEAECFEVRWTSDDHGDPPSSAHDRPEDKAGARPIPQDAPLLRWVEEVEDLREALTALHDLVYEEALRREKGNKTAAARRLGVKRANLVKRLKERGQGGQEP